MLGFYDVVLGLFMASGVVLEGSHFLVNHRFASSATSVTPCGVTREGHTRTPTFPPPPSRLARATPPPGPFCLLLLLLPPLASSLSPSLSQIIRFLHLSRLLGARTRSPSSSLSLSLLLPLSRLLSGLGTWMTMGLLFVARRPPPCSPRFRLPPLCA